MVALYPMGPVADGLALNMTVMSYLNSLYFGLVAGREAIPDVWDIAHALTQSLDELKKAADSAKRS